MNRQQKTQVVESLRDEFSSSNASFVVGYRGLTVSQMQALRKELRANGGQMRVAKARLMKRATEGLSFSDDLIPFLKDQIGVVFASDQAPAVAKVLHQFAKEYEALQLIAGCLEEKLVDKASITAIATLPPREVLLAQVAAGMNAPLTGFVGVLNMLTLRLLFVLKQIAEKK